jgi:tryptophan synthase beta chain
MRVATDIRDVPDKWYNIVPDIGFDFPPPMGSSGYPMTHHDLSPIAAAPIVDQELDRSERNPAIPKELRESYAEWRPTPLFRAKRFEESLDTPARIFYKYEGGSPSGSYEFNTALAQAYYTARAGEKGTRYLVSASGNGEWGASLAVACNYFGIKCKVYMVRASYEQREYGRYLMELLGAEVVSSPSPNTRTGKKALSQDAESPGSLGMALSEAFEEATTRDEAKFAWGTLMNHVILHQTLIGLEARDQLRHEGVWPDLCIAAVGGGSGFGGLAFPLYRDRKSGIRFIAVESAAAPTLTKGRYGWDYADWGGLAPMLRMYTLGHSFVPPDIRAGAMRYHGVSPLISALYREKRIEARTYTQRQAFEAAVAFARAEGFVPSPESSYAIKAVLDEAVACKDRGERKNILFLLSTNTNLDVAVFKDFLEGAVEDKHAAADRIDEAISSLPTQPSV